MEKKERRRVLIHRQKSYLTAGVVTLVAVVAMMGAYQYEKRAEKQEQQEQVTLAEQTDTAETQNTTNADDTQETMVTQKPDQQTENTVSNQADSSALAQTDTVQGSTDTTAVYQPVLHFAATDTIGWPLEGDVILNYSMDRSVYFATLDQYKYNPALIIAGAVNDRVVAASDGQVIGVDTTAETGQTVTIGLGDSYQAIYGQLKELEVSAGDYVSQGDTIGYLAEPTKYYSVEGANLYFAMTKEGKPVNPMDYIR